MYVHNNYYVSAALMTMAINIHEILIAMTQESISGWQAYSNIPGGG